MTKEIAVGVIEEHITETAVSIIITATVIVITTVTTTTKEVTLTTIEVIAVIESIPPITIVFTTPSNKLRKTNENF